LDTLAVRAVEAASIAEALDAEALAANIYWVAWAGVRVEFARRDAPRVPEHWRRVGARVSPVAKDRRLAVTLSSTVLGGEGMGDARKVWLITGTSKGFGRIWAEAALDRGDMLAATARDPRTLDPLVEKYGGAVLAQKLDVTDREAVATAVAQAAEHFGRIDVVINNAGYGHFGMVEELTEEEARNQMETNVFGALWVTQAVLPVMRAQGAGRILQVSSVGGVNAFPGTGMYHASKWALEGISQSLAAEVAAFGIHVTLIEPRGYSTDWGGPSSVTSEPSAAYAGVHEARAKMRAAQWSNAGDPNATPAAILKLVDSDHPPLRMFLGDGNLDMMRAEYEKRLATWEQWDDVASGAASRNS
jgi:NAD(P)-dependent dehydrogenase (short-subunit alcohol dehydrogenase family)